MPRIIITSDDVGTVLYQERVALALLESDFAAGQLIERIAWVIGDAAAAEMAATGSSERLNSLTP